MSPVQTRFGKYKGDFLNHDEILGRNAAGLFINNINHGFYSGFPCLQPGSRLHTYFADVTQQHELHTSTNLGASKTDLYHLLYEPENTYGGLDVSAPLSFGHGLSTGMPLGMEVPCGTGTMTTRHDNNSFDSDMSDHSYGTVSSFGVGIECANTSLNNLFFYCRQQ
jgi:hypothetical protein